MSRSTTWRALCAQTDPDFHRLQTRVPEYEFGASGQPTSINGELTHEGGLRVFYGNPNTRGPYAPEGEGADDLTWDGVPITWDGTPLTWDD